MSDSDSALHAELTNRFQNTQQETGLRTVYAVIRLKDVKITGKKQKLSFCSELYHDTIQSVC